MTLAPGDPLLELGHVHLIGIGGAGMSALGRLLAARGVPLSGSELRDSRVLAPLRALGVDIRMQQSPTSLSELGQVDTVVISTAIPETNPELVTARAQGLRVLHRAQALACAMRGRFAVVVAGTHGKTTSTSMLAVAMQHGGRDPSFYMGAEMNETGTNAHAGTGEVFVAESDESDGSFLVLRPDIALVTNVEADHLDYYGDAAAVERAFGEFCGHISPDGLLVAGADDPGAMRIADVARRAGRRVRTFGTSPMAEVRAHRIQATDTGSRFHLVVDGVETGPVELRVFGAYNIVNAAGVFAVALELGMDTDTIRRGLGLYTGARRRFEFKGQAAGVRVFDDYAHHHSELRATLTAARAMSHGGRLIVAFQPLRFSRTAFFARELGAALGLADDVVVMEIFGSNEDPIPGVSGAQVAAAVPLPPDHVHFEPSFSAVARWLADHAASGDVVFTLGDGVVTMLGPEVVSILEARQP